MKPARSALAAAAVVLLLATFDKNALAEGIAPSELKTILSLHNSYRAQHCVPPLTWSAELAAAAQKWAGKCWIGHDTKRGSVGENIAWGGERTAASAVDAWYEEVDDYDHRRPGFASSTAHFTQMIWRDTKQIGCGVAKCYLGTVRVWVCRYAPAGNWRGKYPQNVSKRCK